MIERNSTYDYHRSGDPDLINEYTICESFATEHSPYAKALNIKKSYGALLGDFLVKNNILNPDSIIAEAGGGYGSLMNGLMQSHSHLIERVVMFDLSSHLLKRQKNALLKWDGKINFVQTDIQDMIGSISSIHLLILNEIIGDLDVIKNVDPHNIQGEVLELVGKYNLDTPEHKIFNFNIGAVKVMEEICRNSYSAFISEHSSDPVFPDDMEYLNHELDISYPREIRLYNHTEYTIRFSHLIKVAQAWNREVYSGPLIDIPGIENNRALQFIFTNRISRTERQEIIYELLDHIREYRWILIK